VADNFPFPIPKGWFALMAEDELAPGQVARVEALGKEFVVFRTESGTPSVVDPYCPHLGAHLGVGGTVSGETLVCPFHGWRFDSEGRCTEVPYAKRIPPKAQITHYETRLVNGWIFVWHDPAGSSPNYEIPAVPGFEDAAWCPPVRHEWTIGAQFQELFENICDPAHFLYVHQTSTFPESKVTFAGATARSLNHATMPTRKGEIEGTIDAYTIGPGFGYVLYDIVTDMLQITSSLPLDDHRTMIRHEFRVREGDRVGPALIRQICMQMGQDIPIWENKTYHAAPVLCDGDGPIAGGRKWMAQFYNDQ